MYQSMRFTERFGVDVVERESPPCGRGQVRVRTLYSGISAGTELTAYRGTNPYLNSVWNPDLTLFDPGSGEGPAYPLEAWGYSEVGRIVEAGDEVVGVHVGDVVWGIWGHRSEAVLEAAAVAGHDGGAGDIGHMRVSADPEGDGWRFRLVGGRGLTLTAHTPDGATATAVVDSDDWSLVVA